MLPSRKNAKRATRHTRTFDTSNLNPGIKRQPAYTAVTNTRRAAVAENYFRIILKTTGYDGRIIYTLLFPHQEKSLSKLSENRKSVRIIALTGGGGQIPEGILLETGVGSRAKNREIKCGKRETAEGLINIMNQQAMAVKDSGFIF